MSKKDNKNLSSIKIHNFFKKNMIFVGILIVLIFVGIFVILNSNKSQEKNYAFGDDVIEMNYFYLSTCPHCHEQEKFHKVLLEKYPNLKIVPHEIKSADSQKKYKEFATKIGGVDLQRISTPTSFIGNRSNVGFGTPETTGQILIDMIEEEQKRIDSTWDDNTMVRTKDLRKQLKE